MLYPVQGRSHKSEFARVADNIEVVNYELENIEPEVSQGNMGIEHIEESYPGEGMLLNNLKSNVTDEEVKLWRYMYKIPLTVEIRVPKVHKKVDWVILGWVEVYELMLNDGMRFPIPRLI